MSFQKDSLIKNDSAPWPLPPLFLLSSNSWPPSNPISHSRLHGPVPAVFACVGLVFSWLFWMLCRGREHAWLCWPAVFLHVCHAAWHRVGSQEYLWKEEGVILASWFCLENIKLENTLTYLLLLQFNPWSSHYHVRLIMIVTKASQSVWLLIDQVNS